METRPEFGQVSQVQIPKLFTVMEIMNPRWFQLYVTNHICHEEKEWGQFRLPSPNNNMFNIMSIYVKKQNISQEPL